MERKFPASKLNPHVPEWKYGTTYQTNLSQPEDHQSCDTNNNKYSNNWESISNLSNPYAEWSKNGLDVNGNQIEILDRNINSVHTTTVQGNGNVHVHVNSQNQQWLHRSVSFPNISAKQYLPQVTVQVHHPHPHSQQYQDDVSSYISSDSSSSSEIIPPNLPIELALIDDLISPEKRYTAIIDLCKKSDIIPDLAVYLWNEPGCMAIFLLEIVKMYSDIYPPNLPEESIHIICSIVALKQTIVSDSRTRRLFLESGIVNFLLPFLGMIGKTRDNEHLRLCILSLLLTVCHKESTEDLFTLLQPIQTDLIRLIIFCLTESISEVSRSMAIKILLCFLAHDEVLLYLCQCYDRFRELLWALGRLVIRMERKFISDFSDHSKRVFKYIISMFMRICDDDTGREALLHCIPTELFDGRFFIIFSGDADIKTWLTQLFEKLYTECTDDSNNHSLSYTSNNSSENVQLTATCTTQTVSSHTKSKPSSQLNCHQLSEYDIITRSN